MSYVADFGVMKLFMFNRETIDIEKILRFNELQQWANGLDIPTDRDPFVSTAVQ